MRAIVLFVIALPSLFAQSNALSPKEIEDGWILLFDGESTFGWTSEGGAKWRVEKGVLVADAGTSGWLRHNAEFADYILRVDFRAEADSDSGVFLRAGRVGEPQVTGYELQIADKHEKFPTGSIVNHKPARKKQAAAGRWRTFEAFHLGDNLLVKLDGKKVLDLSDSKSRSGYIGLEFNEGKKVEFAAIKLRPVGLAPLFNGKNLSGWQEVKAAKVKEPPQWAVRKGILHVEKGPGQLETKSLFDDFILQMEIRANTLDASRHPNSGVFFRGTPNGYWSGYESQIRNEYKNGDRTQAVDFGTGGLYRYQPARKVVSDDNKFFTKTIVARGRAIATWVNGYQVSDWLDTNPEGKDVRKKQAVLTAGPISLQAHDPTTNLDFRNIRIRALPK